MLNAKPRTWALLERLHNNGTLKLDNYLQLELACGGAGQASCPHVYLGLDSFLEETPHTERERSCCVVYGNLGRVEQQTEGYCKTI